MQIFSLTYDVSKNKVFSAYVADSWRDLTQMDPDDATRRVDEMKNGLVFFGECNAGTTAPDRIFAYGVVVDFRDFS